MKIGIAVSDEVQKQGILRNKIHQKATVQWVASTEELLAVKDADYWIDCTYSEAEIFYFEKPTLIHAPAHTLAKQTKQCSIGRFCAWPAFIERNMWEIGIAQDNDNLWIEELMELIGRKFVLVNDEPGLIAPRIVCTIINEAYFALQAGVSSAEEIDVAMKLGTNYPYGPIEWGGLIGLKEIHNLLSILSLQNQLYTPSFTVS